MTPFWPQTIPGWLSLVMSVAAMIMVIKVTVEVAIAIRRLEKTARAKEIEAQEYDKLLPVADPLVESFAQLEAEVRERKRLAKQATCTHPDVTCMLTFGTTERVHYCNECGLLVRKY